jgi:K+-sensing histidine kinase KdpD
VRFGLAAITSLVSAIAFDYFRNWPTNFAPSEAENWVALAIFLTIALVANTLAYLARTLAYLARTRAAERTNAAGTLTRSRT